MRTIIFIALSAFATSSIAEWKVQESVDAMTDQVSKTAYVLSDNGSRFTLIRKSSSAVWGYLKLSGMNQFKANDVLMLRVDKNEPRDYDDKAQKLFGIPSYEWNPSLLGFLIWHGKADEGCGLVGQLLQGQKMVIRYHPNKSTYKDIVFDISKNKAAVREGLGLESDQCK